MKPRELPLIGPIRVALPGLHDVFGLLIGERLAPTALAAKAEASQKALRLAAVADGQLGALGYVLDGREGDLGVASAVDHVVNVSGWQAGVVEARRHRVDGYASRQLEPGHLLASLPPR